MVLLQPTKEQIRQIFKIEDDGPVIFHNWLKFKPDGGAESYQTYMKKFNELMAPKGVIAIFHGNCKLTLIGEVEWDMIVLAEYPQLSVWKEMIQSEGYRKIEHHRAEAVLDSRLVITKQEKI